MSNLYVRTDMWNHRCIERALDQFDDEIELLDTALNWGEDVSHQLEDSHFCRNEIKERLDYYTLRVEEQIQWDEWFKLNYLIEERDTLINKLLDG